MTTGDDQKTDLAKERTILASERTLMAWIRTAFSMITFGFTFYKFFQFLIELNPQGDVSLAGPRVLGLMLVGLGTLGLFAGIGEYITIHRRVYPHSPLLRIFRAYPIIIAFLLALLGIAFFISMLARQV